MSSSESEDEIWCHFLMDNVPVDVPASFIEGYYDGLKLEKNKVYNVFWSPNDEDTPMSVTESKDCGPIVHVSKLTNQKTSSSPIMGWYESILLATGDSFEELLEVLQKKRVTRPTPKVMPQRVSPKVKGCSQVQVKVRSNIKKQSKDNSGVSGKNKNQKEKLASARKQNVLAVMRSFDLMKKESNDPSVTENLCLEKQEFPIDDQPVNDDQLVMQDEQRTKKQGETELQQDQEGTKDQLETQEQHLLQEYPTSEVEDKFYDKKKKESVLGNRIRTNIKKHF